MIKCPACGHDNLAGSIFCSTCGHRFDGSASFSPAGLPPRPKKRWLLGAIILLAVGLTIFLVTRPKDLAPTVRPPGDPVSVPDPKADPKVAQTEQRLGTVISALDRWLKQHMSYPELAELLVRDDFLKPTDFDDAWGQRVDYERIDAQHYRLCSRGRDNLPKTGDDVCLGGRP